MVTKNIASREPIVYYHVSKTDIQPERERDRQTAIKQEKITNRQPDRDK